MSLSSQIETDVTVAMKAREQEKLDALRMVRAALKNEEIALGHAVTDDDARKVLNRLVKQRREAAEQYRAGHRAEQANKEETEAKLIESYLPQQLSDEELKKIVNEVVAQTGASAADFGRVMGAVMARVKGGAGGNRVSVIVKSVLQG